jgi:hypothetical protein
MEAIENLAKRFYGHNRVHKDGEIVPYELVLVDNNENKIPLLGYCHIPEDRVEEFASDFIGSMFPGETNAHIAENLGYLPVPKRILMKHRGSVEYVWNAPAFQIW